MMSTIRIYLLLFLGTFFYPSADTFMVPSSTSISSPSLLNDGLVSSSPSHEADPRRNVNAHNHGHPKSTPTFMVTTSACFPSTYTSSSSTNNIGWTIRSQKSTSLFAKKNSGDDEDDIGWEEPHDKELIDEEYDDDDIDDIEDDSYLVVGSDDDEEEDIDDDDDEEEEEDDDDIDIESLWDEEDEEEDAEGEDDTGDEDTEEEYEYEYEEEEEEVAASAGSSYAGTTEAAYDIDEWDDDDEITVPLQDDPDDPDYMEQKKLVEGTVARREKLDGDKKFDAVDYIMNQMTDEQAEDMESLPAQQEVNTVAAEMGINDLDDDEIDNIDLEAELAKTPDLLDDDPWDNKGEENILGTGVNDDMMERLDEAWKFSQKALSEPPWDKITETADNFRWEDISEETREEMYDAMDEIGGAPYNCTTWLMYDLKFNVSNLILAAVKHNPDAPILFQHWYPQLLTYSRYQHARDRNFDFNWEDVENADIDELKRYYLGFGYAEIPNKAPGETGMIDLEDLDEEEMKMAAFENWMIEVYNANWDKKDFDDDGIRDEDNVYSDYFEMPPHPDLPTMEDALDDLEEWQEDAADERKDYRDYMGQELKYTYIEDEEFTKDFRGHLVVACCPLDKDVEIAEKITTKMGEAFGKQVFVETRVIAHATEEDHVFEVWLESYDIDLLHSKKRATAGTEGWDGPAECDDAQIDYLVERVGFLISDDARYSYRFETDMAV